MDTPEIEEFAKILVEKIRDAAIRNCDRMLLPENNVAIAVRWRAASVDTPELFARMLISDAVDEAIANLLIAIDQEVMPLSFTSSNGKTVDLTEVARSSGDLSGWYGGSGGWCEKYTKERFIDDFADLKDIFKEPPESDESSF